MDPRPTLGSIFATLDDGAFTWFCRYLSSNTDIDDVISSRVRSDS